MAGAGYKLFNTGDVLTAQQVNEYLMQQTIMVFASAAARTTALASVLAEGMTTYLADTNSTEVYNGTAWVAIGADQTPLTTKGDLFTYSTVDTRLGVGTNGQYLQADSTTATGLKWNTVSAVDPFLNPQVSQQTIVNVGAGTATGRTLTTSQTYYAPVFLRNVNYDQLSFSTSGSTWTGTGTYRLGIYNNDATTMRPSTVLVDAGTVNATLANTTYTLTINQTPAAGYYWLALNQQTAPTAGQLWGYQNTISSFVMAQMGSTSSDGGSQGFIQTGVTGAFATVGTISLSTQFPRIGIRQA